MPHILDIVLCNQQGMYKFKELRSIEKMEDLLLIIPATLFCLIFVLTLLVSFKHTQTPSSDFPIRISKRKIREYRECSITSQPHNDIISKSKDINGIIKNGINAMEKEGFVISKGVDYNGI